MALPDISGLSAGELLSLIHDANVAYNQKQQDDAQEEANRKQAVANEIAELTALLGPVGAAPSTTSIRGVMAHSDATIQANLVVAVRLLLQGLEMSVANQIDLAHLAVAD